jgi:hypothetical protein
MILKLGSASKNHRPSLFRMAVACLMSPMTWGGGGMRAAELPDIRTVAADLTVPVVVAGQPGPGKRVTAVTTGWAETAVHHAVYLPPDWTASAKLPVLVELAGNGGYRNRFGDECDGSVEGCRLGYGMSGGRGMIWVCVPFVEVSPAGVKRNAVKWWGDVEESKRYLAATVHEVCERFGGDAGRVVLCGFSRGSIGCNFIGLHDDAIAGLWRAFVCHSHYDGVIEKWPYAGADRATALTRLRRLGGRPQWISHEGGTGATEPYLRGTGVTGRWTFAALPFRNHTDAWVLRPLPVRQELRTWLAEALK